jgi:FixJ family two-component response regulator
MDPFMQSTFEQSTPNGNVDTHAGSSRHDNFHKQGSVSDILLTGRIIDAEQIFGAIMAARKLSDMSADRQKSNARLECGGQVHKFPSFYLAVRELCTLPDTTLEHVASLTPRQCDVMELVLIGNSNKDIAVTLHISQRTVENHRASIMKKTGSSSFAGLVARALAASELLTWRDAAMKHIAGLTPRQRQIMELVLAGNPSKNIATDLGISIRTVENHRATIMKKTGSRSLPSLACLALAAA